MELSTIVRPRRSQALPFVVVLYPLLWLVVREFEISAVGQPVTDALPQVLGFAAAAVVISYAVAALVATVLIPEPGSVPAWARALVNPSNATLAVVSVLTLALGAYVATSSVAEFPQWFDTAASLVGLVVGWPMVASIFGSYAIGNAFPALQTFAVELLLGMFGIALTAVWVFLLSSWITGIVPPTVPRATTR